MTDTRSRPAPLATLLLLLVLGICATLLTGCAEPSEPVRVAVALGAVAALLVAVALLVRAVMNERASSTVPSEIGTLVLKGIITHDWQRLPTRTDRPHLYQCTRPRCMAVMEVTDGTVMVSCGFSYRCQA